ncbi:MAG: T9SS type A sorting domain-containing protein, partial [Ignavibacteria bacterium]|nr:T9SS type A sorting domain-containing protein [Ignavibacteria bacterium]
DISGKIVSVLVNQELQSGEYEYTFDAINLPSGIYFYTMITEKYNLTKRMILIK